MRRLAVIVVLLWSSPALGQETPPHLAAGVQLAERVVATARIVATAAAPAADVGQVDEPVVDAPVSAQQSREAEMFGGAEETAREDELFGDSSGDDERDAEMFGESTDDTARVEALARPTMTDAEINAALDAKEDPLALGAFLFLQAQYAALEQGDPESFDLSAPMLLDAYIDGRPNDRVRAYVRGRLSTDPTIAADAVDFAGEPVQRTRVLLDQLLGSNSTCGASCTRRSESSVSSGAPDASGTRPTS